MPLSQDDRIAISKKVVSIPKENERIDEAITALDAQVTTLTKEDTGNKNIVEDKNVLINLYQVELGLYDGKLRTSLVEADFTNSSNKVKNNPFFPNDPALTTLPGIADGLWKGLVPYSQTKAIGEKDKGETLGTVAPNEIALIAVVQGFITAANSSATITNGIIWRDFLNDTLIPAIPTNIQDPDATRSTENDAARTDATDTVATIGPSYPSFPTGWQNLVNARLSFINTTRIPQIEGYLGTITQDYSSGAITAKTGLYGERFTFIDARLNLAAGSNSKKIGINNSKKAQQQIKDTNVQTLTGYQAVMTASLFRGPGQWTTKIHVTDPSGFAASDSVYFVADKQQEVAATIVSVSGTLVELDVSVPKKYRDSEYARLYKIL